MDIILHALGAGIPGWVALALVALAIAYTDWQKDVVSRREASQVAHSRLVSTRTSATSHRRR